jgi:heptosyltransferase-2
LGGFLEACRVVVTGDTLALHLSLALKRPVVALFGPTCPQEISLFGLGEKIMTPLDCGPCYLRTCGKKPNCMDSITLETIWPALVRQWEAA